jgi:hypothetical protein
VSGSVSSRSPTNHVVKLFETLTGRELNWLPSLCTLPADEVALDWDASRLAYHPTDNLSALLALPSGKSLRASPLGIWALSPAARWLATAPPDRRAGLALLDGENPARVLIVSDSEVFGKPHFSPDGRFLAWGAVDGAVMVCDVEATMQRLEELGLGW